MKVFLNVCQYEKEPYYMGTFRKFGSLKNLNEYIDNIKDDLKKYKWDRCVITRVVDRQIIIVRELKVIKL